MIGCSSRKGSGSCLAGLRPKQLAHRPQPAAAVRQGDFAGFFQGFAGVFLRQASKPLQHARPFDAAGVHASPRPIAACAAPITLDLVQQIGGAAFQAADLLGGDVLRRAC